MFCIWFAAAQHGFSQETTDRFTRGVYEVPREKLRNSVRFCRRSEPTTKFLINVFTKISQGM